MNGNGIEIFENPGMGDIKSFERNNMLDDDYFGFVYAASWGDKIKIGMTQRLSTRFGSLRQTANYSNIAIRKFAVTKAHTNYRENEKILHKRFADYRVLGTELFEITFEHAIAEMATLHFEKNNEEKDKCDNFVKKIIEALCPEYTSLTNTQLSDLQYKVFKNEPDEPNSKFYIKPFGSVWKIPLDSYTVYTKCCKCGQEIAYDLDNLCFNECGYTHFIDLESDVICSSCMKKDIENERK